MECAAAELLAGTQDSLFNDSLEERHIHEKSTKSAQSDSFLEKSPGDKKEQSLDDSLDLDATQLPFDEELTAFSRVPDAGSSNEPSGVTQPTSHSNTVGFQLAENVQASLTKVEETNTTAVDEHHQQVPQNQTQDDDDTCVNATTGDNTCGLSPVSTDSATSKSSTASKSAKVVPSFGRRKSTKNESSTTNTRALNTEVKLSTEEQVPVVLDETTKDDGVKVGVDLDQSKETENPEEDQCVPESDRKSEMHKPKFTTSSASKKKHASKSTTGSASVCDDQTETQEVENKTGNAKPRKSALSESGKKTKVIAQEKKKKEREEKKKEMERKKLEREQKKRETDEKKAEKERLKKERQLELERKKAEREQKKIEQQLKKTEKMNKTEGRKNSKKTIKQSGKENESSNNEATTSESESVPSNIKTSENGDTSPPAPMDTNSTTPETEQQIYESVTMESTEGQCDTTTGRKKSSENTLMCGPTPPEENAAIPDDTSALQSDNLPKSKNAESVNTRLDDSSCEGVRTSEVSNCVVEGQSAALPVENAAVKECDAKLKNRELELEENGLEERSIDDDAESINIKNTEECDENLKNPEQALEEAGVEEKSVNDFSEPDHVSKGREKQKEVAAQGSSVKGDKIKIVFGRSGNKTKVTQDAAKSSVSGKSGKNSSTATTKPKHVGLSSTSDVKKLLKKGSNTSTKISSKNQKSKPKKRTRLREDDSKAKRSRPSNYTGPVWVQCERPSCKKWRRLRDCRDPLSLPDSWTCSMNTGT